MIDKRALIWTFSLGIFVILIMMFGIKSGNAAWEPPSEISRDEIIKVSNATLAMPNIKIKKKEEVFRIRVAEMDWDIGAMNYEPEDLSKIPVGPDGKKIGVFLIHGGSGDHRSMDKQATLLATKFGYKITSMTYPGRFYLLDPNRNWPGDTIKPDGTVRTPIWKKDEIIGRDQYEVIHDRSDLNARKRWGTQIQAKAKEGSIFYYRMAAWPWAFEEAMKDLCRRHFPENEYSIYVNGHSTGGPFGQMLTQRVSNIRGVVGMESTPLSFIYAKMMLASDAVEWKAPFYHLSIRTWRDRARYMGAEALKKEGPQALMRLAMLMEEVFESWEKGMHLPQIKAEYIVHYASLKGLEDAARVTAKRLNMSPQDTEALVKQYIGYTKELSGPGVKPVPPMFLGISKDSRDHTLKVYKEIVIPTYAAMKPEPKVRVVRFDAGVHDYMSAEKDLPMGPGGAVVKYWHDAIMGGFFIQ